MAQQVEHVLGKDEVTGSNPVISSIKTPKIRGFFLFFSIFLGLFNHQILVVVKMPSVVVKKINVHSVHLR